MKTTEEQKQIPHQHTKTIIFGHKESTASNIRVHIFWFCELFDHFQENMCQIMREEMTLFNHIPPSITIDYNDDDVEKIFKSSDLKKKNNNTNKQ